MLHETQNILAELPLYNPFVIDENVNYDILPFLFFEEQILDIYCIDCQKQSTFKSTKWSKSQAITPEYKTYEDIDISSLNKKARQEASINEYFMKNLWNKSTPLELEFTCQRHNNHKMYIHFMIRDNKLFKIGQYPSSASIDQVDLQKYRKILDKDKYIELNKGIGLASHGVGIGSFVYLRRILEELIEESHQQALLESPGWDEVKYKKERMVERIKLLKDYLPKFILNNASLYGILSKGVHELDETTCLKLFPMMKAAIEIILDEKIYKKEQEEKLKNVSQYIHTTAGEFK